MKPLKILSITALLLVLSWLAYSWFTREEWQTQKPCAECEALEEQKQQRLIGTVEILPNGKTVFTDQLTGLKYNLIPCDQNCNEKKLRSFDEIGVIDYATQLPIYFDIEGEINPKKEALIYSFIIELNTRKFINPQDVKGLTFDQIREKYTAVNEETFPLYEASVSEFRIALFNHFTEQQRKQSIPIKEVTWEVNESTLLTIWFIEKQNQWTPIEQYKWNKGMEF
ncbi:hypothetical protein MG290_03140 [Flavobacterium sp. CBA20B-1]|uniref:hypothetical protein n=1 Tax=unclassified Flavobacterium TaxID=196869 RepID=UPI0022253326|nr:MULTISPECIES: hypothetical protein [unclassified Flavobacterium]WCM42688.1 hypothetical protein MG290_03140 [Flavobacterium sp. CBA20B-1]